MKNIFFCLFVFLLIGCRDPFPLQTLNSSWEYAIASESETPEEAMAKSFQVVPHSIHLEEIIPDSGFLWLKKDFAIQFMNAEKVHSVGLGRLAWANETYFNGERIGKTGEFPPEPVNTFNIYRSYSVPNSLIKVNDINVLLVKVYFEKHGYVDPVPLFGETEDVEDLYQRKTFLNDTVFLILCSLFLFYCIQSFLTKAVKTKKPGLVLFSSWASFFAIFYFSKYYIDFIYSATNISYYLYQMIEGLSLGFYALFMMLFLTQLYQLIIPRIIWILAFCYLGILSIILVLPKNYEHLLIVLSSTNLLLSLGMIGVFSTLIYTIKTNYDKIKPIHFSILSFALIGLANLYQIRNFGFTLPFADLSLGLITLAYFISVPLKHYKDMVYKSRQAEDLEIEVEHRISDLEQARDLIKSLKTKSDGDYYLTSLLESPLSKNLNNSKYISIETYIEQFEKIQFKNKNVELGGDVIYTENLRFLTPNNKYTLFFNGDALGKSLQGAVGALILGTVINQIARKATKNDRILPMDPVLWMEDTYIELNSLFFSFNGSMLVSCIFGILNESSGDLIYFNAGHPPLVLYRNGDPSFLDFSDHNHKLGTSHEEVVQIKRYKLQPKDILFIGSDGKDDLDISDDPATKWVSGDRNKFLQSIRKSKGDFDFLIPDIKAKGRFIDDVSIMKISFQENERPSTLPIITKLTNEAQSDVDLYKEKLKSNPNDLLVIKKLSKLLYESERFRESIDYIRSFMELNPQNTDLWFELSVCYKKIGDYNQSKEACKKVREFQPNRIANLINLADNYRLLGNVGMSRMVLQDAFNVDPQNPSAKKLANILDKLGS
jgi:hypothetical protein